ncbi:PspC domain-containing protein [Runella slithyformis]|uniref:Phage shock protein C, PspC n=1 Tax=Runella slithyformis (strain ATCC 29530 / DSM 19594 / LMG 11500 / NCIMB 11436 / LSU 4) TaxID=761193 RepID=A0A7U3ZG77_RUNSL|nr:PspC domain-containing protein [Runella slithyformis]AEI46651.1 phage shock protein C, PspC [Runella slithyformis DSM 19594]
MNNKPLRRIQSEAVLGGVAAGLADYFSIDKAIMRVIFVVLMIFTKGFPVILIYIILWAVLPKGESTPSVTETDWAFSNTPQHKKDFGKGAEIVGYSLLVIGGFMLFDRLFYWIDLDKYIPAALLIGIGLFLILKKTDKPTATFTADTERATPSWTDTAPINDWQPPKSSETKESETPDGSEEPKV